MSDSARKETKVTGYVECKKQGQGTNASATVLRMICNRVIATREGESKRHKCAIANDYTRVMRLAMAEVSSSVLLFSDFSL